MNPFQTVGEDRLQDCYRILHEKSLARKNKGRRAILDQPAEKIFRDLAEADNGPVMTVISGEATFFASSIPSSKTLTLG